MSFASLAVGDITPLAKEEIEERGGSVRQICAAPPLFLVQIPHNDYVHHRGGEVKYFQSLQSDIEVGVKDGRGYLLLHSDGWMCEYRQHAYDVVQTALRSIEDLPDDDEIQGQSDDAFDDNQADTRVETRSSRASHDTNEALPRLDLAILEQIQSKELSEFQRSLWAIANDPATFAKRPDLREAFRAHITLSLYDAPAIREAIAEIHDELATVEEVVANERIFALVDEKLSEAESLLSTLSEEDNRAVMDVVLLHFLQALRSSTLTELEVELALDTFGQYEYLQARPDVERCLRHSHPALRSKALEILVLVWGLSEYRETAFHFLQDSDPHCIQRGMDCLNPTAQPLLDPRVLSAYAHIAARRDWLPDLRLDAYLQLLTACNYELHYDSMREMEKFVAGGGLFEKCPWVDWKLIAFFTQENSPFETTLRYNGDEEWVDQYGRVFHSTDDLASDVVVRAHQLLQTRFRRYRMRVTLEAEKSPSSTRGNE